MISRKIIIPVFVLLMIVLPFLGQAALVNCGNTVSVSSSASGDYSTSGECDFTDFVNLLNNFVKWVISLAGVIFTISLIWGGFLYMTSGEKPANKDKAKTILRSTLYGFIIILCAWLIVYTIIIYVVDPKQQGFILKFIK